MELDELIKSVDLVDYVSQFTDLTERNGEYWGLSPLKEEKTPSFSIRRESNQFYDFSSGVGGNILTFIRHYYKCGYPEAIEKLEEYAHTKVGATRTGKLAATEVAKKYAKPPEARKKARATALPDNYMDRFEKRDDQFAVWRAEGISNKSLARFQVRYDAFSDRIVYPIRSPDGKIINVGGRALDPQWKEKKQRKYTYFFPWGELNTIYGLAENMKFIREKREIVLFEGCKSVLLADTWGIRNTGAILTSHLNKNQLQILIRLGCRVVFALDNDVCIWDDYNIKRLKQFTRVEFVHDSHGWLGEKDAPVDKGVEVWQKLYEERSRYM